MREAPKVAELVEVEKLVRTQKFSLQLAKGDRSLILHVKFPDETKFAELVKRQQKYIVDFHDAMLSQLLGDPGYTSEERVEIKAKVTELKRKELETFEKRSQDLLVDLRRLRAEQIAVRRLAGETADEMVKPAVAETPIRTETEGSKIELWSAMVDVLGRLGVKRDNGRVVVNLPGIENPQAYQESLDYFMVGFSEDLDAKDIAYHLQNLRKLFREKQRLEVNVIQIKDEILAQRRLQESQDKVTDAEIEKLALEVLDAGGVFRGKADYAKDSDYLKRLTDTLKNDQAWKQLKSFLKVYKPITVIAGSRTGDFIIMGVFNTAMLVKNFHFEIPFDLLSKKDQDRIVTAQRDEFNEKLIEERLKPIRYVRDFFVESLGYETEEMKMLYADYENAYLQYLEDTSKPGHDMETAIESFDSAAEKFKDYVSNVMDARLDELTGGKLIDELTDEEKADVYSNMPGIINVAGLGLVNQAQYDIAPLLAAKIKDKDPRALSGFDFSLLENVGTMAKLANPEQMKKDVEPVVMLWLFSKLGQAMEAEAGEDLD